MGKGLGAPEICLDLVGNVGGEQGASEMSRECWSREENV